MKAIALLLLLAGCRSSWNPRELPPDHPASSEAAATDFEAEPDPFASTPTYSLPASAQGAPTMAPMKHGAGQHGSGEQAHPQDSATSYTCPMHPEVIRSAPGKCPGCGMELRPMESHEHEQHGGER
jgi:hypothetical protein